MYFYNNEISNNQKYVDKSELFDIGEIIRGEYAAIEAYRKVEKKIQTNPEAYRLNQFREDHDNASLYWRIQAKEVGSSLDNNFGAWTTFVNAFIETTKILGNKSALWTLKQGELHGLYLYKKMLSSNEITERRKEMIRKIFIPRQKRHINCLDALLVLN
jgi:hypothetical protein